MRIIETILASFVIVAALSFVNIFAVTPASPKYDPTELQKLGYNVLHDLDKQGLLSRYVYSEQWDDAKAALRVTLPFDVYFRLSVYDVDGRMINDNVTFYGNLDTFTSSKNMASVTYGLSGYTIKVNATYYQANYCPRILTLQLVRG